MSRRAETQIFFSAPVLQIVFALVSPKCEIAYLVARKSVSRELSVNGVIHIYDGIFVGKRILAVP